MIKKVRKVILPEYNKKSTLLLHVKTISTYCKRHVVVIKVWSKMSMYSDLLWFKNIPLAHVMDRFFAWGWLEGHRRVFFIYIECQYPNGKGKQGTKIHRKYTIGLYGFWVLLQSRKIQWCCINQFIPMIISSKINVSLLLKTPNPLTNRWVSARKT